MPSARTRLRAELGTAHSAVLESKESQFSSFPLIIPLSAQEASATSNQFTRLRRELSGRLLKPTGEYLSFSGPSSAAASPQLTSSFLHTVCAAASPGCSWEMQSLRGHRDAPSQEMKLNEIARWVISLSSLKSIHPHHLDTKSCFCYKCFQTKTSTVKVAQSCPTLWDPMNYTVHGSLQARILQWAAFPFSRGSSQPRDQTQVSHIAGGFFTSWATREVQTSTEVLLKKGLTGQDEFWRRHLLYFLFLKRKSAPKQIKNVQKKKKCPRILGELSWWLSGRESTSQCRRHGFNSWSEKIPHITATEPMRSNYCLFQESGSHNYWSLHALKPVLCNRRSHNNEKPKVSNKWSLLATTK